MMGSILASIVEWFKMLIDICPGFLAHQLSFVFLLLDSLDQSVMDGRPKGVPSVFRDYYSHSDQNDGTW